MPSLDVWLNFYQKFEIFSYTPEITLNFSIAGACRSPFRRTSRLELVLGVSRLFVQVLRGHSGRSITQCHPSRCQDQLDLQVCHEASWTAWTHIRWQELSWYWQGIPFLANCWRFPSGNLEKKKSSVASPQALSYSAFFMLDIRWRSLRLLYFICMTKWYAGICK